MATISVDRRRISTRHDSFTRALPLSAFGSIAAVILFAVWFGAATPQTVVVDGVEHEVTTHRRTVGALLRDLGIETVAVDRLSLAHSVPLRRGEVIVLERAPGYRLLLDGRVVDTYSWGESVGEVLAEAGFLVDAYDTILVNGRIAAMDDLIAASITDIDEPIAAGNVNTVNGIAAADMPLAQREIVQIQVARAIPMTIQDDGMAFVVKTTAQTVGEALRQAELTIFLGDRVDPGLATPVSPGLKVYIQRSTPVRVMLGENELRTRTRADTVAEALGELRIGLSGEDMVVPSLDTPLAEGISIQITRVYEEILIEEDIAPFDTVFVADANIPIDTQQVTASGAEGITRSRYRVRYENGEEVSRKHEDTWIAQEPANRTIAYGQKIEPRTFTAEDGTQITYWRRIQMHASSYSAGTAGVSTSSPHYGRTRTGDRMRHGIVAVDPSIIPLRTQVYVPGYGVGDALDTGGAIRSRRIDLGYDDSNLVLWSKWVDVYLLWPPPPAHQITWVIPNWPRPPQ